MPEELTAELARALCGAERVGVLGVGAELRGDDIAGVLVARGVQAWCEKHEAKQLRAFVGCAAPENVTGEISRFKPSHLVLVDAADLHRAPGEIGLIAAEDVSGVSFSTHMLPVRVLLDYLRRSVGCEPVIIGIQPQHTGFCEEPSQAVLSAVESLVETLCALAARPSSPQSPCRD